MNNKFLTIAIMGAGLLFLGACGGGESGQGPAPAAPAAGVRLTAAAAQAAGIRLEAAQWRAWSGTVECPGTIGFNERRLAVITPRTSGRIEKVFKGEGEAVAAGEIMVSVYSPEYLAAQAEYLQLTAPRGASVPAIGRDNRVNEQLLGAALAKLTLLGVTAEEIKKLLASRQAEVFLPVRSPWPGVVIDSGAITGSPVQAETQLFKVADTHSLWVTVQIPEGALAVLKAGAAARVRVGAFPGREFPGQLAMIAAELDGETRSGRGRVEIANPEGLLRSGMFATVTLEPAENYRVLAVPEKALRRRGDEVFVFVAATDGSFQKKAVKVGRIFGGWAEITAGLREAEKVVSDGSFTLKSELLKSQFAGE
jgi:RND family efflux transporter MFP subunit